MTLRVWFRIAIALGLLGTLQGAPATEAAWSGLTSIGSGTVVSDLSCAADGNGTAVCAALGTGSTLMVAHYNGASWSGWVHLSGALTAAPSCATIRAGQVVCGSRDANLALVAYLWNGTTWSAPLTVAAGLVSGPSCAPLSGGKALCAARYGADGIVSAVYSGTGWAASAWSRPAIVADAVYGPVQCAPDDVGHAICAYLAAGSATRVREFGTAWSGAINLAGTATRPASCTDAGVGGKAACFVTGPNSQLYGQLFAGGSFAAANWSGWGTFGGLVNTFACAQDGQKAGLVHYACGVVGLVDNGFYTNEFNGTAWSGWILRTGATFIGTPACFALNRTTAPGRVMCALTTVANVAVTITGP